MASCIPVPPPDSVLKEKDISLYCQRIALLNRGCGTQSWVSASLTGEWKKEINQILVPQQGLQRLVYFLSENSSVTVALHERSSPANAMWVHRMCAYQRVSQTLVSRFYSGFFKMTALDFKIWICINAWI